jgi:hypothetical protein
MRAGNVVRAVVVLITGIVAPCPALLRWIRAFGAASGACQIRQDNSIIASHCFDTEEMDACAVEGRGIESSAFEAEDDVSFPADH